MKGAEHNYSNVEVEADEGREKGAEKKIIDILETSKNRNNPGGGKKGTSLMVPC